MERTIKGGFDEYGFPYLDLRVLNQKQQLSLTAKAIIDTGAAHCMIREELAQQLQLEELRIADYRHPIFGRMPLKEYLMDLGFENGSRDNGAIMEGIRAGTLLDPNYPASVIIGVEVLRHCRLEYDGPLQSFTITFQEATFSKPLT